MAVRILMVDDDELLRRSLAFTLEQAGFLVDTAASSEDALAISAQKRPDLVLLDIMLPGMDGVAALRQFRDDLGLPVIFLTARRRELDQILGLELGAEDYITKPFNPDVLVARIHAVLRRVNPPQPAAAGQEIVLTAKEFDLLHALALEPNHVLAIDQLLSRVWGAEYTGEPQIVYVHMRWLREKVEEDPERPQRILTVRGKGYKLVPLK